MRLFKLLLIVLLVLIISQFGLTDIYAGIKGKIIAEDSKQGIKCGVNIYEKRGTETLVMIKTSLSDENGNFSYMNLKANLYFVEIIAPAPYIWPDAFFIDLLKGGIKQIEISLKPGCVVQGRLLHDGLKIIPDNKKMIGLLQLNVISKHKLPQYYSGGDHEGEFYNYEITALPEGDYILRADFYQNDENILSDQYVYPILFQKLSIRKGINIIEDFDFRKENFGIIEIYAYTKDNHILTGVPCSILGLENVPGMDLPYKSKIYLNKNKYLLPAGRYKITCTVSREVPEGLTIYEELEWAKTAGMKKSIVVESTPGLKITKSITFDLLLAEIGEEYK